MHKARATLSDLDFRTEDLSPLFADERIAEAQKFFRNQTTPCVRVFQVYGKPEASFVDISASTPTEPGHRLLTITSDGTVYLCGDGTYFVFGCSKVRIGQSATVYARECADLYVRHRAHLYAEECNGLLCRENATLYAARCKRVNYYSNARMLAVDCELLLDEQEFVGGVVLCP